MELELMWCQDVIIKKNRIEIKYQIPKIDRKRGLRVMIIQIKSKNIKVSHLGRIYSKENNRK